MDAGRVRFHGDVDSGLKAYLDNEPKANNGTDLDATSSEVRHQGDGQARFSRISLRDANGQGLNRLLVGEPFDIEMEIETRTTINSPLIGFHLSTNDREILISSNHHDSLNLTALPAGRHLLRCRYDGPALAPGSYALTFAITSPASQLLHDLLSDCIVIEVNALLHSSIAHDRHLLDSRPGFIRKAMSWSITKMERDKW